ncbi:hypothetical protein WMY93_025452 [Mugilogobius chulae]|uniref:WD repeat domain 63 n=1 Tax=Mugilogobius chulae TaxID=88201 RepID=A0AAW0N6X1_9GOBI
MPPKKAKGKAGSKVKAKDHPEDIFPLVLTSVTQELFDCVADEDVTGENPYKLLQKDDILQDMKNRAADYPEDELLLVYDRDFTYGQSFYLVLTPETKDKLLNPPKPPTPVESVIEVCKTPEPKPWISLGSELEIEEESVKQTRKKICFKFSRERRKFGAALCFSDRTADVKDGYLECASYQDSRFSIKQMQRDTGIQAVHSSTAAAHRHCDQGTGDEGDWSVKATEGLMLYQTFTDQKNMKDKKISCINWHPTIYGVVAVSVTESGEKECQKPVTPSFILFYSFVDPCTPQLLLECPDDILAFEFSPSDANIIVGGCVNGQVVLWDISAYVTHLQGIQPGGRKGSANTKAFDLDNSKENKTPVVRHCALSALENSHKAPITDVQWLPQTFELTKAGLPMENKYNISVQIVTCSPDCFVLFWDIRIAFLATQSLTDKKKKVDQTSPYSAPETFKHLDRTWTPLFRVSLPKIQASGEYAPLKLSFEGYTCNSKKGKHAGEDGDESSKVVPEYSELTIPSAKTLTPLEDVNTKLYIGTKDGEVVYTDWKMEKDESGRLQSGKPLHCLSVHHWLVNTIQRSPFFKDIILTSGGSNFAIWKEGVMNMPILQSSCSEQLYTVGCWSSSRPAVFFMGREDGSIEVWNLLEKTSEPTQILAHVINAKINCIEPWDASSKQHFLAVCDDLGMISVFEIPRALYAPITNESVSVRKYFELEQNRIKDLMTKEETRTNQMGGDESKKIKKDTEKSAKVLEENEEKNTKVYDGYKNIDGPLSFISLAPSLDRIRPTEELWSVSGQEQLSQPAFSSDSRSVLLGKWDSGRKGGGPRIIPEGQLSSG